MSNPVVVGEELGFRAKRSDIDPSAWLFYLECEFSVDCDLGVIQGLTKEQAIAVCKLLETGINAYEYNRELWSAEECGS